MIDISKYYPMHKNLSPKGAWFGSRDSFLKNVSTNNTMDDNWLDNRWSVECCQQISTVAYVDNSKRRLRLYQSTVTPKRIEDNLFVRIGKSEAEVANKDCTRRIVRVLLKLTTDIHSARPLCESWASCK